MYAPPQTKALQTFCIGEAYFSKYKSNYQLLFLRDVSLHGVKIFMKPKSLMKKSHLKDTFLKKVTTEIGLLF